VLTGGEYVATFNQVKWGCWTVSVTNPANHFGTPGPLQDAPADPKITGCTAGNKLKVPGTDDATDATAHTTLDEGRLDISVVAHARFGHAAPTVATLLVTRSGSPIYSNPTYPLATFAVGGAPTTIWVPTGGASYVVRAGRLPADPFWPDAEVTVAVPDSKPAEDAVEAEPDLVEQAATLVVTVVGGGGGDPQAKLTIVGAGLPSEYDGVEATTTGYKYTYLLPAGSWTVTAKIGATRTKTADPIATTEPHPPGDYALTVTVPP
jgi:hypothetical protein